MRRFTMHSLKRKKPKNRMKQNAATVKSCRIFYVLFNQKKESSAFFTQRTQLANFSMFSFFSVVLTVNHRRNNYTILHRLCLLLNYTIRAFQSAHTKPDLYRRSFLVSSFTGSFSVPLSPVTFSTSTLRTAEQSRPTCRPTSRGRTNSSDALFCNSLSVLLV